MLQRYGGEGKGSHILPEIGETVLVEFQGNNAEMPFVIGTLPNLKEKSGYATPDNDIKAIRTRSGIETLSNDAEGSWKQSTPDGNFLVFDGKGNAVLNIPHKLTVNATNIEFNSFNNLEMNVSNTMILNIMSRFFVFTPFMKQIVSGFMSLFSGKALINSKESINIEAEEVTAFGTKKMLVHSDKLTTVNSMEVAEMHGATKNNFTNKPIAQSRNRVEKITNVMVEFRTMQTSYNGEFGFDWLRIDDNGATIEKPYYDCLENGYEQPNGRDLNTEYESKDEAFEHLEKEYLQIAIDRTSTPNLKKYYIPWLNLFPEAVSIACTTLPKPCCEAELRILVDVEIEEPDQIRIVFDKRYFTIDGSDGTDVTPVLITDKVPGPKRDTGNTITIKCIDEFASRQEITVYAYPKDSLLKTPAEQLTLRQVAGKIVLEPNKNTMASRGKPSVKNRKELKMILVQLRTDTIAGNLIGNINPFERKNLCFALHQSLIHGELINYTNSFGLLELDLTNDTNFKMRGKYIDSANGLIIRTEPTLNSYLRQLVDQSTANRYNGSFYVFVFGIKDSTRNIGGRAEGIGKKSVVLYNGRDNFTLNHEVLHGLGLWHTHWDFGNFVFINGTDPNTATIFDTANPPVTNITTLQNQWSTLYTCSNGDTWFYGQGETSSAADMLIKYRIYNHPVNQKYVYKHAITAPVQGTDNVMTYQPDGKTTWHWQWKIIKKNIL